MKPPILFLILVMTGISLLPARSAVPSVATEAINSLGLDLLRQTTTTSANALLSPYSIQSAMAMTWAGADGQTREEMARVLHFPSDEGQVDQSFASLQADLAGIIQGEAAKAIAMQQYGVTNDPLTLTTANRLFGQQNYDFRPAYLALLKDVYQSPFEPLDFIHDAAGATTHINSWVEQQTRDRIQNLIPAGALNRDTRLVLVNAIYLKAPWETKFLAADTRPRDFYLPTGSVARVPTMFLSHTWSYTHRQGYSQLAIPYAGNELQLVILLPDATNGLAALEAKLTPAMLAEAGTLSPKRTALYLPKFKLEPPVMSLAGALQTLGMKSAFNVPKGSANFDRMAPRHPVDYLYISDIFHKTFLKLDEAGTEAAAATAVVMQTSLAIRMDLTPPVEFRVDHPFLFAIQHRASGACLFLGHVTDPR